MNVFVKTINGSQYAIQVSPDSSVANFMEAIQDATGIPMEFICLSYAGRQLEHHRTIADYGILNDSMVHLILKMRRSNASPAATTNPPPPPPIPVPCQKELVEKCWSACYSEEWEKALPYLESGQITLDQLEQRTKRELFLFFAERNMVNALRYVVEKRGKPATALILPAINQIVKQGRGESFKYLLDEVTSIAELEGEIGAVQPLHYALLYARLDMLKRLLDDGANPNYYAERGGEFMCQHPGAPILALAQGGLMKHNETTMLCLALLCDHPQTDVNIRQRGTGHNALHLVAMGKWTEIDLAVQFIKHGVDIDAVNEAGKLPEDYGDLTRLFKLARKGKFKTNKRQASSLSSDIAEVDLKRVRIDGHEEPIFHTLDAFAARLKEWTRELREDEEDDDTGELRADQGVKPLTQAIETDLVQLAEGDGVLAPAAKLAQELAVMLKDVGLSSETFCYWIPFVISLPSDEKKKEMTEAIKFAIRAPKSDLITTEATKDSIERLFPEEEEEEEEEEADDDDEDEDEEKVEDEKKDKGPKTTPEEFWNFFNSSLVDLTEVQFPEEAICYPVFMGGTLTIDTKNSAIVGVFAIRVDT